MKGSKYLNIYNVNPLYFIVDKVDGFIEEEEEEEGNKYLNFTSTDNKKRSFK